MPMHFLDDLQGTGGKCAFCVYGWPKTEGELPGQPPLASLSKPDPSVEELISEHGAQFIVLKKDARSYAWLWDWSSDGGVEAFKANNAYENSYGGYYRVALAFLPIDNPESHYPTSRPETVIEGYANDGTDDKHYPKLNGLEKEKKEAVILQRMWESLSRMLPKAQR